MAFIDRFGWHFVRKDKDDSQKNVKSFVLQNDNDVNDIVASGSFSHNIHSYSTSFENNNEKTLIHEYRDIANYPDCDSAIDDIVNEAIVGDLNACPVALNLANIEKLSDQIKEKIHKEFNTVLSLLDFNLNSYDVFRRWYIDGKLAYHIVIDSKNPKKGIQDLRYIDATKIRKIKEVTKSKANKKGLVNLKDTKDYFIYDDSVNTSLKIHADSIAYVTSGLYCPTNKNVISYLHKARTPVTQLRNMEHSLVIYRISRAPERRIFYVDVGNMQPKAAEEHLRKIAQQYKTKMEYNAQTGDVISANRHMSMLEDIFLARTEGGRGTEIDTLPGGDNLGDIDDILYFQKKLYKALNVPISRLESESEFSLGRSSEITRDELKFKKFIDKIRKKFSGLFIDLLKKQLLLKGVINLSDWDNIKRNITIDYMEDNYFSMLKQNEILGEQLNALSEIEDHIGKYYSHQYVREKILRQSEQEIKTIDEQIQNEKSDNRYTDDDDDDY